MFLDDGDVRLYLGDALETVRELPDESVDCVVTSPPYWGLRDYGTGEWEGGRCELCGRTLTRVRDKWVCLPCQSQDEPRACTCGHEEPSPCTCGSKEWTDCDHVPSPRTPGTSTLAAQSGGWATTEDHETASRSRSQLFRDVCGKCGARRVDRQMGLEPTPDLFVQGMVELFREIRRVLAPHGTCWVNLGDSYATGSSGDRALGDMSNPRTGGGSHVRAMARAPVADMKPKDLVGIPWRVAFALQADGWWLRSDIIWSKPNPMPESVTDRPTKAHEYIFMLTKQPRYWFDTEAVREPSNGAWNSHVGFGGDNKKSAGDPKLRYQGHGTFHPDTEQSGRNVRSVWNIATQPYPEAHFATYPEELARRCILAGCPTRVCRVCGKPSERIVEHGEVTSTGGSRNESRLSSVSPRGQSIDAAYNAGEFVAREKLTVGWSDCGHNALECESCGIVLDADYNAGYAQDETVRGMRDGNASPRQVVEAQEVLHQDVLEQAQREEPGEHQGLRDGEGVQDAAASRSPDGEPRGVRNGAPPIDGGTPRADADPGRGSASPERGEGRQPGGELGSDAEAHSRPEAQASGEADHLPALRREDHHVGSCPSCSGRLVARPEHLRWRPGRVLDPFIGSGTTAKVARDHQRHAIGIDLNQTYLELAARRLQQLSLLT